jgi:putative ABC transport system ATP-binding protein
MRTTVLRGVSLDIRGGELAVIMGPSGSGKSTLLAALSGLLRPDEGSVVSLDVELWSLSAEQRKRFRLNHCGFVFQSYNLFPGLTARQQLELVLQWGNGLRRREAGRRAAEVLEQLGLAGRGHLKPSELSGGEQQRVAIGRALVKNPALCFADEPTAALDWRHGKQVVELLHAAAHERGATVVVVAHDTRLLPFADRVFRLEDGALAPDESLKAPRIPSRPET